MAEVQVRIDASGIASLANAIATLPAEMRDIVVPNSLNDTGDGVFTLTKRNLAQITGAKPQRVGNVLRKKRATPGVPIFQIVARDRYMSLKDFNPRQLRKGVKTTAYGNSSVLAHTFIVATLGGHVFKRTGQYAVMTKGSSKGKRRQKIAKLWGPAIPKEMLRAANAERVMQLVRDRLPMRVSYWTTRALAKAAAKGKRKQ